MHALFKWLDRISAIITIGTLAYTVLHFLGVVGAPQFDLSNGRRLFLAVVLYEIILAVTASGASALIFRATRNVTASMIGPVVAWSFANVDVMRTLFGETVWGPVRKGWWIFSREHPQNSLGFALTLIGAAIFLLIYALLFVRRAARDRWEGGEASAELERMNIAVVVLGSVITAFLAHLGWIWLGAVA